MTLYIQLSKDDVVRALARAYQVDEHDIEVINPNFKITIKIKEHLDYDFRTVIHPIK